MAYINYDCYNWCGTCEMKYPKSLTQCLLCHKTLRRSPVGNAGYRKRKSEKERARKLVTINCTRRNTKGIP